MDQVVQIGTPVRIPPYSEGKGAEVKASAPVTPEKKVEQVKTTNRKRK